LNCTALKVLINDVVNCRLCPRLIAYCQEVAHVKRKAYRDWVYWGKPVPPFGDASARLLILGLAPAAHGANRTGRMFTGDRSGEFLYRAMYRSGFASQPTSVAKGDGLRLSDAYISASVRCAPPDNKPLPAEIRNCRRYLEWELDMLPLRVVIALGRIAFDVYLSVLRDRGIIRSRSEFVFAHNREFTIAPGQPVLIASYHPSQQNTSTGKLTDAMLLAVFKRARKHLE